MNTYDVITLPNESIMVFPLTESKIVDKNKRKDLRVIATATLCISLLHIGLWFII